MGLLEQPQQQPPQQQAGPSSEAQQPNQEQAQQMYEKLASMALQYVYSDSGADMVLEGLELEGGDIVQNAGNVVAKVLTRLIISARTSGKSIPAKMMIQVGMELSAAVIELAEKSALIQAEEAGALDSIFYAGITIVGRELPEDLLSEQERAEIGQTLDDIEQMQNAPQAVNQQEMTQ